MIFQSYFKLFISILFVVFSISKSSAQHQNREHSQNQKIEQLLIEKRKINLSLAIENAYKIQIFYGNSEDSKKKLQEFNREFKDLDSTIIFNSPNYKVWVGNFKTRRFKRRTRIL